MSDRILVVDDEKEIAQLVELYLVNDGFSVVTAYNGTDALKAVEEQEPSLAVLDVMLPDMTGFELCRRLREQYLFPIIMLTAKVEAADKITGLTMGADDYITKPFNPLELSARVKSQLRRFTKYNSAAAPAHEHDFRGLYICLDSRKCQLYGEDVPLTPLEFDILWYLCDNSGRVVSSEELFEKVWGQKYLDCNNTVMSHIARLREKLREPPRRPRIVKTVWGVGYTVEK